MVSSPLALLATALLPSRSRQAHQTSKLTSPSCWRISLERCGFLKGRDLGTLFPRASWNVGNVTPPTVTSQHSRPTILSIRASSALPAVLAIRLLLVRDSTPWSSSLRLPFTSYSTSASPSWAQRSRTSTSAFRTQLPSATTSSKSSVFRVDSTQRSRFNLAEGVPRCVPLVPRHTTRGCVTPRNERPQAAPSERAQGGWTQVSPHSQPTRIERDVGVSRQMSGQRLVAGLRTDAATVQAAHVVEEAGARGDSYGVRVAEGRRGDVGRDGGRADRRLVRVTENTPAAAWR